MVFTLDMERVMEIESGLGKSGKKPKDMNAPKRPASAFFQWANKARPSIMKANPDWGVAEVGKHLGKAWKKVSESEKAGYQAKYEKAKPSYAAKSEKHKKSNNYKNFQHELMAWKIHSTKKPFRADENAPKRAPSAYRLYAASVREEIVAENPDFTVTEVMKEQGIWWKALSEAERQPWNAKAAAAKAKHAKAAARYMKTSDYQSYVEAKEAYKAEMVAKRNKLMGTKKRARSEGGAAKKAKKAKRSSARRSASRSASKKRSRARRARTPKAPKRSARRRAARRTARRAARAPRASKSRSASRKSRTPKASKSRSASRRSSKKARTPKAPKKSVTSDSDASSKKSSRRRRARRRARAPKASRSRSASRKSRTPKASKRRSSSRSTRRSSARKASTPKAPRRRSRSRRSRSSRRSVSRRKARKAKKKTAVAGSMRRVWSGTADKTKGGLTKKDLMLNKSGKVVSKKQFALGRKAYKNSGLAKWGKAVQQARAEMGVTGFVAVKKGTPLYKRAKAIYSA